MKSQKYWNCKVFLCFRLTTIAQLNFLFVLYFWSSYCKCLKQLLMKWAQFINNYQKSTPGRPMKKQLVLQSCFLMYYLWIWIWWQVKGSLFLMNMLPDVHICHLKKKSTCTSFSWGDSKMNTLGSIASLQRVLNEIQGGPQNCP